MKPSDTKGFWSTVAATDAPVAGNLIPLEQQSHATDEKSLVEAYVRFAQSIRAYRTSIPTAAGNPSKGPRYYAVTMCEKENEPGLTDSSQPKGRRWACNTCFSFAPCVWTDGPTPEREEQEQEWADWAAKQGPSSHAIKTRKMIFR